MIKKVICYGIGIPLTAWFGFDVMRVAILWASGTLVPHYSAIYIGERLPLVAIGILLIWIAHKKTKLKVEARQQVKVEE